MSVTSVIVASAPCSYTTLSGNKHMQLEGRQPELKLQHSSVQPSLLGLPETILKRHILSTTAGTVDHSIARPLLFASKKLCVAVGKVFSHLAVDDDKVAKDVQRLNALDQAAALIRFAARFPNLRSLDYRITSGSTRTLSMFCSCALPRWKYLKCLKVLGTPVDRHEWLLLVAINCPQLKSLAVVTTLADYSKVTKQIQHLFSSRLDELKLTVTKTSKETAAAGFALEIRDMPHLTALTLMIHVPAERKSNQRICLQLNGLPNLQHLAILQQNPEIENSPKIWGMELALEAAHVPQITSLTIYDLLMQVRLRELPQRFPNLEKLHLLCVDASYLRASLPAVLGLKSLKQVKLWPEPPTSVMADWARTMPNIQLLAEKPLEL